MKLECDVIRDLLPLYAEKLASPASSALVEQHLAACPACRAELERMEKPVPVQPEPQPDAPLKNIRSSLNRRRLRTMLCSFAAALALAAVCGFGWYGYTACDRVSFFDARLQAYYRQAENGANGWVLETRAEDVYLKPTHADEHYGSSATAFRGCTMPLTSCCKRTQTFSAAPDGCALTARRW